jgi:glutamate/aspartate transport system substrate-binding protein
MRRVLLFIVAFVSASTATSAQILEGRLKQIHESKVVELADRSDASPFSFASTPGQPDGYTIDLCKFIVHSIELQLSAKLAIEWVRVV